MCSDRKKTVFWKVDAICPDPEIIRQAGLILRRGGLVAFPTETVYGLGANALDVSAVEKIFTAKGRPQDNPLIVHVSGVDPVYEYTSFVPQKARLLMEKFWPGPLTLILPGNGKIPEKVSGGLPDLAFRMPDHAVALALIKEAGVPVAAPSANLSGRPSPTAAGHVLADLEGRIDVILDGGPSGMGVESTVLDMTGDIPAILRPGGITPGRIRTVTGAVILDGTLLDNGETPPRPRSPGMKYRHYAPSAPLVLVEGSPDMVMREIIKLAGDYTRRGKKVGILCRDGQQDRYPGLTICAGTDDDPASVAAALYAALRLFEGTGVDIILAEGVEARGMGLAVANRLRRAAGGNIIKVRHNQGIPTFTNNESQEE
ncbi:MAG: L-threonylcarbamoyladenylate synthase [Actinobacteria bacterium]|nr:L-threonylcarbamoyladenylate synthase [Actinomycetota bacterium]